MSGIPDYALSTTVAVDFTTRAFSTGVPTTLAGSPVISVLEENNATPITAGITLSVDRASVAGLNQVLIIASGANGFEAGKGYSAYISTGTVGGTSVIGEVVGSFTIEKQSALRPTTAGRTLDVTATGAAGVDWGNLENPTTANNLSATNIDTDQVVASVAGAVGSVTGAVGSVTGSVGSIAAGGITTASFAAGAINAAAVAADTGNELADALLNRDMATGTDSGTDTIRTVRQALRFLRNAWAIVGITLTVNKEDDTTVSWTSTITATPGADPITANDPTGP